MLNKHFILGTFLYILIVLLCAGCKTAPEELVVSKNTKNFENPVSESCSEVPFGDESKNINIIDSFSSTDGTVNIELDINQTIPEQRLPAIQVTSHFITAQDAWNTANALFPNAIFYETEPERSLNYSKSEIQVKLNRWSQYANSTALQDLYGAPVPEEFINVIRDFINRYTKLYENAPEKSPHTLSTWEMKKSSLYTLLEDELSDVELSKDSDEISVQFEVDGIPYCFSATTRNQRDFKVNMMSCYIYAGQCPMDLDDRIFNAQLCRTEEPSQTQLLSAQKKAEEILSAINLGKWKIDECYTASKAYADKTEYTIHINAVPVFNGTAVLRRPQLTSLRNKDGYAPEQYLSDVEFVFAPEGELLSFSMFTPTEVEKVISANTLSTDVLFSKAKEMLMLTDLLTYSPPDFDLFIDIIEEELLCNVKIRELEYGLSRIKLANTDDRYCYVPSFVLKGCSEIVGKTTGKLYSEDNEPRPLIILNAIDGSVISFRE